MADKKNISEINLKIELDDKKVPSKITWEGEGSGENECKAFLLSVFDKETKETFKIDLWTNEMEIREMDRFFYHTLNALNDTYMKATNNHELANAMKSFVDYFGEKINEEKK